MTFDTAIAAFLVGLLGAGHCFGMCGGITAALSFAIQNEAKKRQILLAYNVGRIFSYGVIGLLAGLLGLGVMKASLQMTDFPLLRTLAAIMLILMGFYLTGWWKILVQLEKLGSSLWKIIQPLGQKFMPVRSVPQALVVGMVWGWLPCGLVYSALVFAAATADPSQSCLVMVAFGIGTFPAVFLGGLAGNRLKTILQQRSVQTISGLALIAFGIWTAYVPFSHAQHGAHQEGGQHDHHSSADHSATHEHHAEPHTHMHHMESASSDETLTETTVKDSGEPLPGASSHSHAVEIQDGNIDDSRREKQHENSHHH
ncbi:hypothetical protein TDB9533_01613 [Thalassocella blandensis]|nr:hypothetical protein TDB9533_01613 [Thalassocella blandensis]